MGFGTEKVRGRGPGRARGSLLVKQAYYVFRSFHGRLDSQSEQSSGSPVRSCSGQCRLILTVPSSPTSGGVGGPSGCRKRLM
jgi:hypothetical protein